MKPQGGANGYVVAHLFRGRVRGEKLQSNGYHVGSGEGIGIVDA